MDLFDFNISHFLDKGCFDWGSHALERGEQRGISLDKVIEVLRKWDVVENEYNRKPFPTALIMGNNGPQPIHVVVAVDEAQESVNIVTVYEPNLEHFEPGFRVRKST